jgi:BMFP domain-containing protein YqiC
MFKYKFDPGQLDELTHSVLNKLPSGLQDVQRDVEKNLRAA